MSLKLIIVGLFFVALPAYGQINFNANTGISVVSYPGSIPCPASSCSGGGSLTGANYTLTPSDFGLPMTRATDNSTMSTANSYDWSYTGGAWALPFDTTDTRFVLYTSANSAIPFQWNGATLTATKLYGSSYSITSPLPQTTVGFSYTQPYTAYYVAPNASSNPALFSIDFTSAVSAPTLGSGITQLADLSTCVAGMAGIYTANTLWTSELTVSEDDQTFLVGLSTTAGQGSSGALYVVVWNRSNGCRVWNTGTGAVTGAWGSTGTIGISDHFTLHDVEIGQGGTWAAITASTCNNNGCAASPSWKLYAWNVSTLTVNGWTDNSRCGHAVFGYSYAINECAYNGTYNASQWYRSLNSNPNQAPPNYILNTAISGGQIQPVDHSGWQMDNSTDTNPSCGTTYNLSSGFPVVNVYDDEILCHQTSAAAGSNVIWRFGHTYTSTQSSNFEAEIALGASSSDGRWFLWTSDWDGMLGNTSGASNTCTLGTNCRNDVFIMALPQNRNSITGGTTISGGVKIQ